jgi:hypothetical protein
MYGRAVADAKGTIDFKFHKNAGEVYLSGMSIAPIFAGPGPLTYWQSNAGSAQGFVWGPRADANAWSVLSAEDAEDEADSAARQWVPIAKTETWAQANAMCSGKKSASPTRDRECGDATVCQDDEYESTAKTPTTDRKCSKLRVCSGSEFETEEPTPTSNRECQAMTTCKGGEFETTEPTDTSDRVCTKMTACEGHEWETKVRMNLHQCFYIQCTVYCGSRVRCTLGVAKFVIYQLNWYQW